MIAWSRLQSLALGALIVFLPSCDNELIANEQRVNLALGNLQSQYQRRADLVPSLVETVKASAANESATLQAVMDARASATAVKLEPGELGDSSKLQAYAQAQGALSSGLRQLLAVSEAYPDLKASQGYRDLQVQLEGTENRIARAREEFNTAVAVYNTSILTFPNRLWAGSRTAKQVFQADPGSQAAPKVKF
jgi:LemA protein